jgi:hypothetical protein
VGIPIPDRQLVGVLHFEKETQKMPSRHATLVEIHRACLFLPWLQRRQFIFIFAAFPFAIGQRERLRFARCDPHWRCRSAHARARVDRMGQGRGGTCYCSTLLFCIVCFTSASFFPGISPHIEIDRVRQAGRLSGIRATFPHQLHGKRHGMANLLI